MAKKKRGGWGDWITDRILRGMIRMCLWLPLRQRLGLISWFVRRIVAPAAGYRKRALANLAYVWPDMPQAERIRIADAVADNMARTFIEFYDLPGLRDRMAQVELEGEGLEALHKARDTGQPVVFLTGHFGNYEAARVGLVARGFEIGGLFRRMSNPYFNEHYTANMLTVSGPAFEQGRKGTIGLIKHLRAGGMAMIAFDVYDSDGVPMDFLGKPAPTLTSAADMALKTGALLVPLYGIRQPDGQSYRLIYETPIPHRDPVEMMKEATRRLEARIQAHPEQWLWFHRRWKPERQRKRAAAKTAP